MKWSHARKLSDLASMLSVAFPLHEAASRKLGREIACARSNK
jgi:hypothetical protein